MSLSASSRAEASPVGVAGGSRGPIPLFGLKGQFAHLPASETPLPPRTYPLQSELLLHFQENRQMV